MPSVIIIGVFQRYFWTPPMRLVNFSFRLPIILVCLGIVSHLVSKPFIHASDVLLAAFNVLAHLLYSQVFKAYFSKILDIIASSSDLTVSHVMTAIVPLQPKVAGTSVDVAMLNGDFSPYAGHLCTWPLIMS